jgi:hypothetical protein
VIGVMVCGLLLITAGFIQPQGLSPSNDHHSTIQAVVPTQQPVVPTVTPTVTSSASPTASDSPTTPTAPVSELPTAPVEKAIPPPATVPSQLLYPDIGITGMSILPMDGRSELLDPPIDSNAHWLNNYGKVGEGAGDTAYIIAHSCGLGYPNCSPETFPFNNLSSRAAVGQRITVITEAGTVHYRVTDVFSYNKHSSPAEKRGTWNVVPDRLVMISCNTADLLGANVVVFAQLEK